MRKSYQARHGEASNGHRIPAFYFLTVSNDYFLKFLLARGRPRFNVLTFFSLLVFLIPHGNQQVQKIRKLFYNRLPVFYWRIYRSLSVSKKQNRKS